MIIVKPFKAYRPVKSMVSRIAALPYDVYSREEARVEVEREPESFLRVDRAETQFPEGMDIYAPEVYERARDTIQEMIRDHKLLHEDKACYYLYELTQDGRSQTGIVGCASIDDYQNGIIRKHENTREDKELDRIHHVDICNMNTGPIFLAYHANAVLRQVIAETKTQTPEYDFVSPDGVGHRVWVIDKDDTITLIAGTFASMDCAYIADGHHRAASAVKVGLKRRAEHPEYTGDEEFNYFLSIFFADEELKIFDYNRVILDSQGLDHDAIINRIRNIFTVEGPFPEAVRPDRKGSMGMYDATGWYRLTIHPEAVPQDPVGALDVSLLQNYVLEPLFAIADPKTDDRIRFVGGIRGLGELEKNVREGAKVAFAMYPTSIAELFAVADAGLLMPPKSTWFEPKLRSGIFLHELS